MLKKIDNDAAKKFAIVYVVCWIISAITCAVVYFKWFAEARELQRRANHIIERDIVKEVFDDISNKPSCSSGKWDDLPDVNDEESFTSWVANHEDEDDFFVSVSKPWDDKLE